MELDIKSINDLYFERYIETKKMIDCFHEMIQNDELQDNMEDADKIGLKILNDFVSRSHREGVSSKNGNHS